MSSIIKVIPSISLNLCIDEKALTIFVLSWTKNNLNMDIFEHFHKNSYKEKSKMENIKLIF